MSAPRQPQPSRPKGFVFAATGARYIAQARRAARSLRQQHADAEIDLFADRLPGDPVFAAEHLLADSFFRPKIEALRRSRFERTICFDSDTLFLAPLDGLFAALDTAELLGVLALNRTGRFSPKSSPVSPALPVINSGVLALRRTAATQRFLAAWEETLRETGHNADQRSMRDLLFASDVTFLPVGMEYNFKNMALVDAWGAGLAAPRILHSWTLHRGPAEHPARPVHLREALGPRRIRRLKALHRCEALAGQSGPAAQDARAALEDTVQAGPETPPQASVVELLLGAEAFAESGVAMVQPALEARATQVAALHICCVGGTEGVRDNVTPLLLRGDLVARADVTCFEPTAWRRARAVQGLGAATDLTIEDCLIGEGATAPLYQIAPDALRNLERDPALPAPVLHEAQGLATTDAERARDIAASLAPEIVAPGREVARAVRPQMRLADALQAAGRPSHIDLLVLGSDGVGHRALEACDLGQSRPVLVLCDVTHLSPLRRLEVERTLSETHWTLPLGQHLFAVRRAPVGGNRPPVASQGGRAMPRS